MLPGAGVTVWLALPALLLAAEDLDSSTCLTLDPFDSALPQTTPSPYTLSCSKTGKITNQDSIIFTIKSSRPRVDFGRFVVAGPGPRERCGRGHVRGHRRRRHHRRQLFLVALR
ncbi:uncharacterized protein LOC124370839 [Homalodisca vitripennis]|uniref:uncharacterized protein LOC124370839 n=1 Tax=Homalodisca vitripennis TaxID=197043 RepID=UPI001EEA05EE|nr:uncharacterized protein LOC124370839 [Homalodisca vitripennis]